MRRYLKLTYPNKGRAGPPKDFVPQGLSPEETRDFWPIVSSLRTVGDLRKVVGEEGQLLLDLLADRERRRQELPELFEKGYYSGQLQDHYRLNHARALQILNAVKKICEIHERSFIPEIKKRVADRHALRLPAINRIREDDARRRGTGGQDLIDEVGGGVCVWTDQNPSEEEKILAELQLNMRPFLREIDRLRMVYAYHSPIAPNPDPDPDEYAPYSFSFVKGGY